MYLKLFINKIFRKIFFRKVVTIKRKSNQKEALIYYKTESLYFRPFKFEFHTNEEEIDLLIKLFIAKGFNLTIIDRTASRKTISSYLNKKYNLLLANCAGNSSPQIEFILNNINAVKIIAYATGPDPNISNKLVNKRHNDCKKRLSIDTFSHNRIVRGLEEELKSRFTRSDYIFCIGKGFSSKTYSQYKKKVFGINPSISNNLNYSFSSINNKNPKRIIYFGGSGNICKGLDLVIDSVLEIGKSQEIYLDIFSPGSKRIKTNQNKQFVEEDFWNYYLKLLEGCDFIRVNGFVPIGSKEFLNKTQTCSFNIFPTAAEGCATSVLTCMRRAIIPVANYEAGIKDIENFGILLKSNKFNVVKTTIEKCINLSHEEIKDLSFKSYQASWDYSPEIFSREVDEALNNVLK